jgi:hypothetical protein
MDLDPADRRARIRAAMERARSAADAHQQEHPRQMPWLVLQIAAVLHRWRWRRGPEPSDSDVIL